MKFGFAVPAYGKAVDGGIAELVDAGEELGFDSAWWPDHIAVPEYAAAVNLQTPFLEPLAACAWGLGRTSRLRFGTDVLVAPYRHPLAVAAMIGTMGALAGDRLVLGVGIGYLRGEFEVLGADYDDARRDDRGVGARAPRTARRVLGRAGAGASAGVGRRQQPARAPTGCAARRRLASVVVAARRVRRPRATRSSASGATPVSTRRSRSRSAPGPTRFADVPAGGWPPAPARAPEGSEFRYSPEFWMAPDGRPRLVGSPDDLIGDLQLLADAGVDHVTLRFGTVDLEPYERFAAEVLPAFV